MHTNMLKAKLHRVTVTHAELDYEGSCAIDDRFLQASGIHEYEQIHIYNITNGQRFVTYAIKGEAGSGMISVNGAAAHHANPGDLVIICAYGQYDAAEIRTHKPRLIYVHANNDISHSANAIPAQAA